MNLQPGNAAAHHADPSNDASVHIIGAGPAGLTAAYELCKQGLRPVVLEASCETGGISRTVEYRGYHLDIGGHRFYTKVPEIEALWHEVMGTAFLKRPRLSRIYYDGRFFKYPLEVADALSQLGLRESAHIVLSYLKAQIFPRQPEESFEDWVINRFGARLYETFFRAYTEKVWGISCKQIRADWAAQRIKDLSVLSVVRAMLFGNRGRVKSLIEEFHYPVLGPGLMWQRFAEEVVRAGGELRYEQPITRIEISAGRVVAVQTASGERIPVEQLITSMPLAQLIQALEPAAPPEVLEAAASLRYRDFLIVGLILDEPAMFPDNWIYVHSEAVQVGRIQNFKNWSSAMVPDEETSCLGMEYFCNEDDELWKKGDAQLIQQAYQELEKLGLRRGARLLDGFVVRQHKAYPVYDDTYRAALEVIIPYLASIPNLQTIGRNGLHRYNNQDHSMLTGILAARNILGESHNLWEVNTERSYYEIFTLEVKARGS